MIAAFANAKKFLMRRTESASAKLVILPNVLLAWDISRRHYNKMKALLIWLFISLKVQQNKVIGVSATSYSRRCILAAS